MKLSELGEFGLIHRIRPLFTPPEGVILGIGDDCAVLPAADGRVDLVTTDLLIENIHFLLGRIPPEDLGHKALAVNLSDIAAMGGKPRAAFLSLGLPGDTEIDWLDRFFAGWRALGERCDCPLLGGDTTRSKSGVVINVTVLGTAPADAVKFRSDARPGDVVAVTGELGDSGAGLRLLLGGNPLRSEDHRALVLAHHRPRPHLEEGAWLAGFPAVHAMMDVSDGIDSDLQRIIERSRVGVAIDVEALPVSEPLRRVCHEQQWFAPEIAATAGEDYCLLCTVDRDAFGAIATEFRGHFGRPLFAIGAIDEAKGLRYQQKGNAVHWKRHGFDHFKA